MGVVAYILFFVAGLAFGFAAPGRMKLLPLAFPVALWLIALLREGFDGLALVLLLVALAATALGIVVGSVLDRRGGHTSYA
jgi:hypothetical protein